MMSRTSCSWTNDRSRSDYPSSHCLFVLLPRTFPLSCLNFPSVSRAYMTISRLIPKERGRTLHLQYPLHLSTRQRSTWTIQWRTTSYHRTSNPTDCQHRLKETSGDNAVWNNDSDDEEALGERRKHRGEVLSLEAARYCCSDYW